MTGKEVILFAQWFFLGYFILLTAGYLALHFIALARITRYVQWRDLYRLPSVVSGFEIPISILAPAYNEEQTIAASVRSLLQLDYPAFEVIVVNDGSKDGTLEVLKREFGLVLFPESYPTAIPTREVRGVYRSKEYPSLRVIDKVNGGKADSLNAGLNAARNPLFCCIDADSILERNSLKRVVQPFLEDATTVAAGGTVRIANGCRVEDGYLLEVGMPRHWMALFQIVEYLRAFLFGRLGWSPLNAMLIISGAFGLFRRDAVQAVGGYRTDTVGEDMELVVRLHRHFRLARTPYRITFVPDPICWTEAPESLRVLKNQRVRWQRGLSESLWLNRQLMFHPRGGAVGWLAFPFMVFFEWLEPLIQVSGYLFMGLGCYLGLISPNAFFAFMVLAIGMGVLLSVNALLLEEVSFRIYPRPWHALVLFAAAILENFGYRQLNSVWRLVGFFKWFFRSKSQWGQMTRRGIGVVKYELPRREPPKVE